MLNNLWARFSNLAHFLIFSVVFVAGASPEIGQGPSSVLTTVVSLGGLPNPPGYPLYGLIANLLQFVFPGDPAHVLNLFAAICMAGCLTLLLAIIESVHTAFSKFSDFSKNNFTSVGRLLFAIGGLAMYLNSPVLVRASHFAERYSLNALLTLASLWWCLSYVLKVDSPVRPRARKYQLVVQSIFVGLSVCSHYFSVPLMLFFWLVSWRAEDQPKLQTAKLFGQDVLLFVAGVTVGLSPWLWSMITAHGDPLFNWGSPKTLALLWDVAIRQERGTLDLHRDWAIWSDQWLRQYRLLWQQFQWLLLLAGPALVSLVRRWSWRALILIGMLWLATGELSTFLINFPVPDSPPVTVASLDWWYGNYYWLFFLLLLGLMGWTVMTTLRRLETMLKPSSRTFIFATAGAGILVFGIHKFSISSDRNRHLNRELAGNFESLLPENSVHLLDVDGLYFPLTYMQQQQGRLPRRVFLHASLLLRSWYVDTLIQLYPEWTRSLEKPLNDLKVALLRIENQPELMKEGAPSAYFDLLRKIGLLSDDHQTLVVTHYPEMDGFNPVILTGLSREPSLLFDRWSRESLEVREFEWSKLKFDELTRLSKKSDFWAKAFSTYIKRQAQRRAEWVRGPLPGEARKLDQLISKLTDAGTF